MFTVQKATFSDFQSIREIAFATWPDTYGEILSKEQLQYMLEKFYAVDSLFENAHNNQIFYMLKEDEKMVGFFAIEHHFQQKKITRLHKLYILPSVKGRNAGRFVIEFIENEAKEKQSDILSLNVNKYNKAVEFYKKIGFEIVFEEIVSLDFGYIMDDYRMEKNL